MSECTLCNKDNEEVLQAKIKDITICSSCSGKLYKHFLKKEHEYKRENPEFTIDFPFEICNKLDQYVVSQDLAKEKLAVAVYNHYVRLDDEEQLDKSNMLTFGPTGTGKTHLAKTIAKILDVPFVIADATTVTEAGYVGEDVENIILKLFRESGEDIEKTERGIIYIDEIDKIGVRGGNASITRDVSGEGVQQALLKIIEGTDCNIPAGGGRKHPQQSYVKIDTTNILFICGGAFVGLDEVIKNRLTKDSDIGSMGFSSGGFELEPVDPLDEVDNIYALAEPEDFHEFGLIPEFIGRLPVFTPLNDLNVEDLMKIMTEPKNNVISQFEKIFTANNINLKVSEGALKAIAKKAMDKKTGARGLRSILESVFHSIILNIHEYTNVETITVNKLTVTKGNKPTFKYREQKAG